MQQHVKEWKKKQKKDYKEMMGNICQTYENFLKKEKEKSEEILNLKKSSDKENEKIINVKTFLKHFRD